MSSTTFSYAQAAKGATISQPSPQLTSSSAPPSIKDDVPTANTSVSAPSVASVEAEVRDVDKKAKTETESMSSKQDSDVVSGAGSASSTVSAADLAVKVGRDSDVTTVESQNKSEEKGSRSTSRGSQPNNGPDSRKGRKGKKSRPNDKDSQSEQTQDDEKEKEPPKPVVLSEAPPPAVNFWAKRIEAQQQAAKVKAPSAQPVAATSSSAAISQDSKKSQQEGDVYGGSVNGVNGEKTQKKPIDQPQGSDQASRRSAPRGSRATENAEKSSVALPPVADASSWPDPKSAAAVEETTRKPQEKEKVDVVEKEGQDEAGTGKKKAWVNFEITPSVVFNTPLPPRGAKPRGGARGGREAGPARSSQSAGPSPSGPNTAADRTASVGASTAPKTAAPRTREGSVQSRTASQPQPALLSAAKQASFDGSARDQRKAAGPSNGEPARDSGAEASTSVSKRASSMRDIRTEGGAANFEFGHSSARALPHERGAKEGTHANGHGQQYPAREGRSDRGRGAYRGRGGHTGGAGSHIQGGAFIPNGQYPTHAPYSSRQNSTATSPLPHGGQFPVSYGQPHRGRREKWGGSGPSAARNAANGASFPSKQAQHVEYPPAAFTPVMYPNLDPIVGIIRQQVEYYLSVENLCKDHYLRMQMDSQGFVPFAVVAGFKRMRELVKDPELIRVACSLSDSLDYGVGEDGIERLRNRDRWHSFVLPLQERSQSAQNDGPAVFTLYNRPHPQMMPYGGPVMHPGYHLGAPGGMYAPFTEEQMYPPLYTDGAHYEHTANGAAPNGQHYVPETQLSAKVPEFTPPMSPLTLESMTSFTDDQVEKLMIVLLDSDQTVSSGAEATSDDSANEGTTNGVSHSAEAADANGDIANGSNAESSSQAEGMRSGRRSYVEIKRDALELRENAQPGETPALMRSLYRFWGQMLLKDFNNNVYTEFRDLATEDALKTPPSKAGMKYLLDFYENLLLPNDGPKPWPPGRAMPGIFQLHYSESVSVVQQRGLKLDPTI